MAMTLTTLTPTLTQGASSPDPTTVYVDLRALRHDRVTLVERGRWGCWSCIDSSEAVSPVSCVWGQTERGFL
jgi:hypothetical protein